MQPVPVRQSWEFWQLVVAAAAALLGFLGGTLIKYGLDRRRDRRRQRDAAHTLATALHAEIAAIRLKAGQLLGLLGQSSGAPAPAYQIGRAIGIPKATIFEQNADQLGLLPLELCRDVVQFYGVRSAAEGMLDVANAEHRDVLLEYGTATTHGAGRIPRPAGTGLWQGYRRAGGGSAGAQLSAGAAIRRPRRRSMISDQDIRRSAWLIIKRWEVDAAAFAAIRADALLDAGDMEGSAVWRNIATEIVKLQAEKVAPGETVQ
jgi:hypothetical protein